uniref:Reticulocyte-binding protein 2 like a n=1 Tax=Talaromyces marneffei PM1 TaxID=1077442 RepID=A0A093URC1_TALMA
MADDSSPDYKSLLQRAEELLRQAEDREHREAELRRQEAELRKQAEDREQREAKLRKQAEEREQLEAELRRKAETQTQPTAFREFVQACHELFSQQIEVGTPTKSTKGHIPAPTGKYCPTRLRLWSECPLQQREIYNAVCDYLQPAGREPTRLFASLAELHGLSRRFSRRVLRSEKDLESYERFAVEDHVHDIIAELCKIPAAQERFRLGNGIAFDNHAHTLDDSEDADEEVLDRSSSRHPRADQFCIHRVDGTTNILLTTVEYKPPHKLSVKNLRKGLRPMEFWEEVLAGSVLAQEYHVMIQEGLEYSYITNGLALVLLRVPYHDPSTLYYYPCEPNRDVNVDDSASFREPATTIGRVLCLCLMSFQSQVRDQSWRNAARSQLHIWKTSFDHTRSQIPDEELQEVPPDSEYPSSEPTGSEYFPSSPLESTSGQTRRISSRSRGTCVDLEVPQRESMDSSDSDTNPAAHGRKRGFSQIMSSPSSQRSATRPANSTPPSDQRQQHTSRFCTQQCLLGLQQKGTLDSSCPNVYLHRHGHQGNRHPIDNNALVQLLKDQLDQDLDHNCTPFGVCGSYGAPFRITCAAYGYTVVGKGTTSKLWKEVSREAEVYQVLRKVQGLAVPVFLGAIDLKMTYFLHGAGEIRHMLLMAWGGREMGTGERLTEISKSTALIRKLGVMHGDLRLQNMLWNDELGRVMIIDFHRSEIRRQLIGQRHSSKRSRDIHDAGHSKRRRLLYT